MCLRITRPQRARSPPRNASISGAVHLGDLVEVGVVLDQRDHGARLDAQRRPELEQRLVARRLDDDAVEADVVRDERVGVVPVGGLAHRGVLAPRGAATSPARRTAAARAGLLLERRPHRVDLGELARA